MKTEKLTTAEFLIRIIDNKPVILEDKEFFFSFVRNDTIAYVFPLAYNNKERDETDVFEIADDVILIDLKRKLIIVNEAHEVTVSLAKQLKKEGYKEPAIFCAMCPLKCKCINNIKEILKQTTNQPCRLPDSTEEYWFDQMWYKIFESDITKIQQNFKKGK